MQRHSHLYANPRLGHTHHHEKPTARTFTPCKFKLDSFIPIQGNTHHAKPQKKKKQSFSKVKTKRKTPLICKLQAFGTHAHQVKTSPHTKASCFRHTCKPIPTSTFQNQTASHALGQLHFYTQNSLPNDPTLKYKKKSRQPP